MSHGERSIELTLITPMYNESDHIAENIEKILTALRGLDLTWEYVLVNDGSTDDSLAKAEAKLANEPNCRIVHYDLNHGRGCCARVERRRTCDAADYSELSL